MAIRLRPDTLDAIKADRSLDTDEQLAAVLRVDVNRLQALRDGARIGWGMAVHVAAVQGTGLNLSPWIEEIPASADTVAA